MALGYLSVPGIREYIRGGRPVFLLFLPCADIIAEFGNDLM
jgi:hypothetical protein